MSTGKYQNKEKSFFQPLKLMYEAPGYYKTGQKGGKETGFVRMAPKCQRNEPCPCGSGAKFKNCCKTESNMLEKAYAAMNAANEETQEQEEVIAAINANSSILLSGTI